VRSIPWIELTLVDGTVVRIPQENLAAPTTVLRTLRADNNSGPLAEARHAWPSAVDPHFRPRAADRHAKRL
jgi:hypothetical protein